MEQVLEQSTSTSESAKTETQREISPRKKAEVQKLLEIFREHNTILVTSIADIPSFLLQKIRKALKGSAQIRIVKLRVLLKFLEAAQQEGHDLTKLSKNVKESCAIIFSNSDVFKLIKIINSNKENKAAKAGQKAKEDITIESGVTSLMPGPIVTEMSEAGLKTGIEKGKVAIKETFIVEKGSEISKALASVLFQLEIKPITVGLIPLTGYDKESNTTFSAEALILDIEGTLEKLNQISRAAFDLSIEIEYPTKDNIKILLTQAGNEASIFAIKAGIITKDNIAEILMTAQREATALEAKLPVTTEQPATNEEKTEEKVEEVPKESE